jgi:hypothetical protein
MQGQLLCYTEEANFMLEKSLSVQERRMLSRVYHLNVLRTPSRIMKSGGGAIFNAFHRPHINCV